MNHIRAVTDITNSSHLWIDKFCLQFLFDVNASLGIEQHFDIVFDYFLCGISVIGPTYLFESSFLFFPFIFVRVVCTHCLDYH